MKEKTSITLSFDLLSRVDRMAGKKHSRSAVVEGVLRSYFRQKARAEVHSRDLELINEHAEELNSEALDVLKYQNRDEIGTSRSRWDPQL